MRPDRKTAALAAMAALLFGCAVGPNYRKPVTELPPAFGEAGHAAAHGESGRVSVASDPGVLERWWGAFQDPELDSLIDRALRNNRDLKTAVSRVREARAERQVAEGALIPELNATAGYNRSLGSKNVDLPLSSIAGSSASSGSGASAGKSAAGTNGRAPETRDVQSTGTSQNSTPGGPNSPFGEGGLPGVTTSLYQAGFDAVWELDVFGGTRRAIEAADAEAAAAAEGVYGVRVTLLAEVATTYMQLRSEQEREKIARRNIESQRRTWRISFDKFNAGLGDAVEVAQESAQLKLAETALPPLAASERMSQHALAFLLGEDPTALSAELSPNRYMPRLPPQVPVGVPSELLLRRPDIRMAERNLAAASAEVGEATAQLYPQFSLTGSFGLDASQLKSLPNWGSRYYSIAPGVSWPILDWAQLHAEVRVQNEVQAQALLAYQAAVSQALKDVEDALVQYEFEHDRHAGLVGAVAAARRARQVTAQVYSEGLADQTATLQAERAVFQAEDTLAQSEAALRVDLVALYKALGGGWDVGG